MNLSKFHFRPHSFSWVALHPQPKGVIQFIGGAFFGTYPTLFYRRLLRQLYDLGYTVVALPFRFTFDHWSIALGLLEEHYIVRKSIIETAERIPGCKTDVYLDAANYYWICHSLGCKYIALLELLSYPQEIFAAHIDGIGIQPQQWQKIQRALAQLTHTLRQLELEIQVLTGKSVNYGQPSIWNEASLLLAPAIADLNGAIPIASLERLFQTVLTVYPTIEQTHTLIRRSQLFNLTHLIQFDRDAIARPTCRRLVKEQPHIARSQLPGTHLTPLGWHYPKTISANTIPVNQVVGEAVRAFGSRAPQLRRIINP